MRNARLEDLALIPKGLPRMAGGGLRSHYRDPKPRAVGYPPGENHRVPHSASEPPPEWLGKARPVDGLKD